MWKSITSSNNRIISAQNKSATSHSPERKSDFAAQAWYLSAL
jgi:hypothetical protein